MIDEPTNGTKLVRCEKCDQLHGVDELCNLASEDVTQNANSDTPVEKDTHDDLLF